jgi:cyanophycinase
VKKILILIIAAILFSSCEEEKAREKVSGKLFIIGGGARSDQMLNDIIDLAGIRTEGYMYVLPMASSVPDSSILWAKEDFSVTRVKKISGFNFQTGQPVPQEQLDSLRNAKLIYISGGDQSRFMSVALNTPVMDAIQHAYKNGSVIAGTSAGAAVMSSKMITGNQMKHPDSESGFITIEADNVEISGGLGLLTDVIIDQHFIKRQRLNRLVAAAIENPDQLCIGIDESTAIIVDGNEATVTGKSQVIIIKNNSKEKFVKNGLLGSETLKLSVYLPGQKFKIR